MCSLRSRGISKFRVAELEKIGKRLLGLEALAVNTSGLMKRVRRMLKAVLGYIKEARALRQSLIHTNTF